MQKDELHLKEAESATVRRPYPWRRLAVGLAAMLAAVAFALLLPQPANAQTPTVSSVRVSDPTEDAAKATVTIANPASGTMTVYLRLRVRGTTAWSVLPEAEASSATVDIDFQHSGPDTSYDVQASLDPTFLTRVARTTFSSPRISVVLASLIVKDIDQTNAVFTVTFNKPETDTYRLYMRIRPVGGTDWESVLVPPGVLSIVEQTIQHLTPVTEYMLHASTNENFTGGQNKFFRFSTLPPDVESLSLGDPGQTVLVPSAFLTASDLTDVPVYLRYRVVGTSQWLYFQAESQHDTNNRDVALGWLHGLTSGRDYELEASTDPTFPSDRTVSAAFTTQPPAIGRVESDGLTQTTATVTVAISAPNGDRQTVYARYREEVQSNWTDLPSRTITSDAASWTLDGLRSGTRHELEASFDSAFPQASTLSGEFTTASPSIANATVDHTVVTMTTAEVAVTIVEPNGDTQNVNVQYRTSIERSWTSGPPATSTTETATATLSGLSPHTAYYVRVSLDPNFPEDAAKTTFFVTDPMPPSVVSVYVKSVGTNVVDIVTLVDDPSFALPVLMRYRETSSQQWSSTITGPRGSGRWERRIAGLTTGVEHEVQVSTDAAFPSQSTQSVTVSTLQATPSLSRLTVSGVTMTEATATVRIANPSGTETVYVRHREAPSGSWSSSRTDMTDTGEVTFTLSGLTAGHDYQVQAAQAQDFPATDTLIAAFTTEQPAPVLADVTVDYVTRTSVAGTVVFTNPGTANHDVTIGALISGQTEWRRGLSISSIFDTVLWEIDGVTGMDFVSDTEYTLYAIAGFENFTGQLDQQDSYGTFTTLPPAVTAVDVHDEGLTSATLRLAIADPNGRSYPVNVRFRAVGETSWTDVPDVATDSASVTVTLAELTPEAKFEVQASIDSAYAEEVTATATVSTLPFKPKNIELTTAAPGEVQLTINLFGYNPTIGPKLGTYVRYRQLSPQGPWYAMSLIPPLPTAEPGSYFNDIFGLTPDTQYEVQASSDARFSPERTESLRFSTLRPTVSNIAVVNPTLSGATLELLLQGTDGASRTVYSRYRPAGSESAWTTGPRVSTSTDTATLALTYLRAGADYEVEVSLYSNFPQNATTMTTLTTESARIVEFSLKSVGQTEAEVNLDFSGHNLYVVLTHYRYRTLPSGSWSQTYVEVGATRGTRTRLEHRLPLFASGTEYELQASTDPTFPSLDSWTLTFTTSPPVLFSLTVDNVTATQAEVTVTLAAPNENSQTVYLQNRTRGESEWSDLPSIVTATATGAQTLTGLLANTVYELRASLTETFPNGETATARVETDNAGVSSFVVSNVGKTEVEITITLGDPIGGAQRFLIRVINADIPRSERARLTLSMNTPTATFKLSGLSPATSYLAYAIVDFPRFDVVRSLIAFDTLPPDPRLSFAYVDDTTSNAAEVTVTVVDRYGRSPMVHLRHRTVGEANWEPTTSLPANADDVVFPLSGLDSSVRHEVQMSLDPNFSPGGITSISFTTLQATPFLSGVTIANIMQTSVEATVSIASPSGTQTVNLRHRQFPIGRWSRAQPESTDTGTAEFPLTGLEPGSKYQVEASMSSTFPAADTRSKVIATLPPDPSVARIQILEIDGYDFKMEIHFAHGGTTLKTVYLRYRVVGDRDWNSNVFSTTTTATDLVEMDPDGLKPETLYEFEASLDDTFPRGATASTTVKSEPPKVVGVTVGVVEQNTVALTTTVKFSAQEDQPVYTRYRTLPSGRWVNAPKVTVDNPASSERVTVDYDVTGLIAGKDYEIEASTDPGFRIRHIRTFTTMPPTTSGVHVHEKSPRQVGVSVSTKARRDSVTVYTRYRSGSDPWTNRNPSEAPPGHVLDFQLGGLMPGKEYELQASVESDFPGTNTKSFMFSTLGDTPTNESLNENGVTKDSAKAMVKVHSPDRTEHMVHLRCRELGESGWTPMTPEMTNDLEVTFDLTNLKEDTLYEMQAALNSAFDADSVLSRVFATRGGSTTTTTTTTTTTGGGGGGGGFGPAPVAPKFADGFRATREVAENALPGDAVGVPVPATHPDDLEITYSLSGTDAASFTVDEETGQIQVKEGVELELGQTLTLNLTATDSAGFGAIIIVAIEVVEAMHHRYDANRNGNIERDEVIAAVKDYFDGDISKDEVIELIKLYFAG